MSCSAASSRRSCMASRKRWCSSIRPSSASTSSARLRRSCPLREVGHLLGRCTALDQGLEHGPAGDAEDIAGDARQLDVGGLQQLEQPVALGRLALHQLAAVAQQLAQVAQRLRRHEALGDQAVADQIGDPLGILHVGLAAGHVADVPRIADDQLEMPLQHGIDRPPVDARALHADMRHTRLLQPVAQRLEIAGHGRETCAPLWSAGDPAAPIRQARHHRLLMHVQPGTPLDHHLHHRLLRIEGDRDAAGTIETLPRVLPVSGGDKEWYLYATRAGLLIGVASHRRDVSLNTIARREARTNRPAPPPFSSIVARRRARIGCSG